MTLSADSLTLMLLFSKLELDDDSPKPLTLREWNPLAHILQASDLRPGELLGWDGAELQAHLALSKEQAERMAYLLSRKNELSDSLNRLESVGIRPLTRADADYPQRYRQRLKDFAPPILYYAGEKALLGQPGIAVVGSRHLDPPGQECAKFVGNACGVSGQVLYSGGAKGVDTISMESALEARGAAVAILADNLAKVVRGYVPALKRGDLCLMTPYNPNAGFSVGAAMGRNRLIYSLADYAIVVASNAETGGTWAGATEALKNRWVPVFVLEHGEMPKGNNLLLQRGAISFPHPFKEPPLKLPDWLKENAINSTTRSEQPTLF